MTLLIAIFIGLGMLIVPRITLFIVVGAVFGWGWAFGAFIFSILWCIVAAVISAK